tara:strand:+ start:2198 stop:3478 length:1281 start_codon:yes stop_codon:yes gene_type:complete
MKKIIGLLLKPLNPVDLEFGSRLPRDPYNFFERIKVIIIGYKTKDKNSFLYILNFLKYLIIRFLVLIYLPIIILFKIFGYKFVVVNYWQFGAFAQQMSFLIKDVSLKKNKKYLVYVPNISVVNIGLLNIFKKQIQIISNTLFCILLYPLFHSELLRKSIIEYDEHYSKTQTYKINQKILNFDKKYFDFEMDVKKKLKDYFFELFNFNYTDKFAAINLRTGSFYKDYEYNLRNSNPKKYLLLINELRKKGFKIICFNNDIKEFQNLNNVMIFPKELKFRKDELEIFILKEANLFITNMFGPKNVASVLGTPSLVCDTFPYSSIIPYNEKDVTIPKIIEKNKIKLSFKEILNNGYFHSLKKEENINLIENTSEDILDGLNQILDKSKINKNYANNRIFKEIMEKEISCIDGLGTISEIFLEKNKYLLD